MTDRNDPAWIALNQRVRDVYRTIEAFYKLPGIETLGLLNGLHMMILVGAALEIKKSNWGQFDEVWTAWDNPDSATDFLFENGVRANKSKELDKTFTEQEWRDYQKL